MQFDNPMITFELDSEIDSLDAVDLNLSNEDSDMGLQEQLRNEVQNKLNVRSFLHGTFYTVLVFTLLVMFFEVEFDILENDRINGLIALTLVLGVASTVVKSQMDDRVYDPNYIPSANWRFIVFIFLIVGEILLFLLARDLIEVLAIEGLAVLAVLLGAVNLAVLWQFSEEEFDDYLDPPSDVRTVTANYITLVVASGIMFLVRDNVPIIQPITSALRVIIFLFYSGLFWTYALFDRETINTISRLVLSVMISLFLLPMSLLLLDRLGITMTSTVIIVTNFSLATLGFLVYNARPRLKDWLYAV